MIKLKTILNDFNNLYFYSNNKIAYKEQISLAKLKLLN